MKKSMVWAAAIAAVTMLGGSAQAVELTDGTYGCWVSSMMLGDIQIEGNVYRGPAYDGKYEGDYPFEVVGGTINWGGPLGGISEAGTVVSTVITDTGSNRAGFDITIQNKDSGNFQTIGCSPK